MLIRLLLLFAISAGLWAGWKLLRPHPLKRIPMRWRVLASHAPMMREALRIRASMVRVLLRGHGAGSSGLVQDVDRLIETIARALQLQSEAKTLAGSTEHDALPSKNSDDGAAHQSGQQVHEALAQLGRAHHHLLDTARAEIDVAITDIRGQLGEQTDFLRMTVAAQKEVEQMLERKGGDDDAGADSASSGDAPDPTKLPPNGDS